MEDLGFTEISNVAQQMEHTGRESGHNTKEAKKLLFLRRNKKIAFPQGGPLEAAAGDAE